jgi:hypothetical protein
MLKSTQDPQPAAGTPIKQSMPIMLYYIKYKKPALKAPDDGSFERNNVLTLYCYIDRDTTRGSRLYQASNPDGLYVAIGDPILNDSAKWSLVVHTKSATSTATISSIPVDIGGWAIVTYTSTLLILTSFIPSNDPSRRRIVMKEVPGRAFAEFTAADVAAANQRKAPDSIFPYDNTCIPNFADIAIKLGYL